MKNLYILAFLLLGLKSSAQIIEYQRLNVGVGFSGIVDFSDDAIRNNKDDQDDQFNDFALGYSIEARAQYRVGFNKSLFLGLHYSKNQSTKSFGFDSEKFKQKSNSFGPLVTFKFKSRISFSSAYISLGYIYDDINFEYTKKGQMLSTASAVGHGGMLEMGSYYFLTDYLSIGPKINLKYVSVNDIKETNYTVPSDIYKEYNKFGISLGVALNYFY